MKHLTFNGGYQFNFRGAPSAEVVDVSVGESLRFDLDAGTVTWVCEVAQGAHVDAFAVLARAKDAPEVCFVSPVAGTVARVVVSAGSDEGGKVASAEPGALDGAAGFVEVTPDDASATTSPGGMALDGSWSDQRSEARAAVARAGLWWRIRDGFTGAVAGLDDFPEQVIVRGLFTEPFLPAEEQLAVDRSGALVRGLEVLGILAGQQAPALVVVRQGMPKELSALVKVKSVEIVEAPATYPAENLQFLDGLLAGWSGRGSGRTWVMDLQDVLRLGDLAATGVYDVREYVALAGEGLSKPSHAMVFPGSSISHVLSGDRAVSGKGPVRVLLGGMLTGEPVSLDGWVTPGTRSVVVVPEHQKRRFLGFLAPGLDEDSFSYGFLSNLAPGHARGAHAGLRGQVRYCISCSYCEWVCPVGLNPQTLWKLGDIGEVEEAASQGLMRCIGCGLCSYVCPAKIELTADLKRNQEQYRQMLAEEEAAAGAA